MRFWIMLGTPVEAATGSKQHSVPSYGADGAGLSTADRRDSWTCSRRRYRSRRRAAWIVLPSAAPRPRGLVLLVASPAASKSAAAPPLALAIPHPANRLTAGGTAVACLIAAGLQGRLMAPRPVAQEKRQKTFCCVTTRRRNLSSLRWLRHRWDTRTARTLRLGVPGFGRRPLTSSGLAPCRLPAPDRAHTFEVLAVMLVPTPRLVLAATAFAQADPRPRSSRPGTAAASSLIMTATHGSAVSQGTARGERANVLLGCLSQPGHRRAFANLYFNEKTDRKGPTRQGRKLLEKARPKETMSTPTAPPFRPALI